MLTPVEIRGQKLKGKMGGYNKEDVDQFISRVAADYETLYSDNQLLKEKLAKMEFELSRYHKLEESMNQTLMVAQQAAEDLKTQASREADLLIRQARQQVAEVFTIYEDVVKRAEFLIAEVKGMLQAQTELLSANEERIRKQVLSWGGEDIMRLRNDLEQALQVTVSPGEKHP